MDDTLTTDQFRILRNARDGCVAPSSLLRPKTYLVDVEVLLKAELVTSGAEGLTLTPTGTACLEGSRPRQTQRASLG